MLLTANLTKGGLLGIVNPMLDRFYGAKVSEHESEVVVPEIFVYLNRHGWTQRAGFDRATVEDFEKQRFVIVGDARGVRRNVRRDNITPRTGKREPASEDHAWKVATVFLRRVAIAAASHAHEVSTANDSRGSGGKIGN